MKKIFTLLFVLIITLNGFSQIAAWDLSTLPGGMGIFGASPLTPTSSDPNVTVVGLTRGSGVGTAGTAAQRAWGGDTYSTSGDANVAIAANSFWTFSFTANAGFKLSLSNVEAYNIRRSSSGGQKGQWQYQVGAGAFTNLGGEITWGAVTTNAGNAQVAIPLSGVSALQNVPSGTTVTFRIAIYGATGTGTCYIFDETFPVSTDLDFVISGTSSAALPIELISFNANKSNTSTKISWQTASEQNNNFFSIERSQNGNDFDKIGEVKGIGNSIKTQNYSFVDASPVKGTNYYRLRQTDFDGKETVSKTVSVTFDGKAAKAKVYPTVVKDILTVELASDATTEILVRDITGRLILTKNTEGPFSTTLDLGTTANGLYFITVQSNQGLETIKVLKQ